MQKLRPSSLLEELPTEEELRRQRKEGVAGSSLLAELPTEAELQAAAPAPSIGPAPGLRPEDIVDMEEEAEWAPAPPEHGIRLPARPIVPAYPATPFERMGSAASRAARETLTAPTKIQPPHEAYQGPFRYVTGPPATMIHGALQAGELGLKAISSLFAAGMAGILQGMREIGFSENDVQSTGRDLDALISSWVATRGFGPVRPAPGRRGEMPPLVRGAEFIGKPPATIEEFLNRAENVESLQAALRSINDPVFRKEAFVYLRERSRGAMARQAPEPRRRGLALPAPPGAPLAPPAGPRPAQTPPEVAIEPPGPLEAPPAPPAAPEQRVMPGRRPPMPAPPAPAPPEAAAAPLAVPETEQTLSLQWDALLRGDKPAVLFPPGQPTPTEPPGFGSVETAQGTVVFRRAEIRKMAPASVPAPRVSQWVKEQVEGGRAGLILGYGVEAKPPPEEPPTLVETRGPAGEEVQTIVAPTPPPPEVLEAAERVLPPEGGEVVVSPPEGAEAAAVDVIGRRLRPTAAPSPAPTADDAKKLNRAIGEQISRLGEVEGLKDAKRNPEIAASKQLVARAEQYIQEMPEEATRALKVNARDLQQHVAEMEGAKPEELGPPPVARPKKPEPTPPPPPTIPFKIGDTVRAKPSLGFAEGKVGRVQHIRQGRLKVAGISHLHFSPENFEMVQAEAPEPLPPAPSVAARRPVLEPWEMTRQEFWRSGAGGRAFEGRGTSDFNHKEAVKEAFTAGKTIPPKVLAEYPELARSMGPPTKPPSEPLPAGVSESDVFDRIEAIRKTTEDISSSKEPGRVVLYDPEALAEGRKKPIGAVSGGGRTLDVVAEIFDEAVAVQNLSPSDLLEAIKKDKENPTYMRLRRAVAEQLGKEAAGEVPEWIRQLPSEAEVPTASPSGYAHPERLHVAAAALEERLRRGDLPKNPKELREAMAATMGVDFAKDPAALDDLFDGLEVAIKRLHRERRAEGDTVGQAIIKATEAEDFLGNRTRTLELAKRQQFSTPLPIAEAASYALDLRPGETVVEPTAGTGNLLAALPSGTAVLANEMDPRRVEALLMQGYPAKQGDALRQQLQGSVVLMNPPWGKYSTGRYGQTIPMPYGESVDVAERFVVMALRGIPAGGRLVAVMPTTAAANPSFVNWLKETHTLRALIQSPPGAYITRGTDVESVLLVVDKGRTPDAPEPIRAAAASWEDYASLAAPLAAGGSHARVAGVAEPALARRPQVGAPGPAAAAVPGPAQPVPPAEVRVEGVPAAPPAGPPAGEPGREPEAGLRRLPGRPVPRAARPGPGVVAPGVPGEPGAGRPEPGRAGEGLPPEPRGPALPARLQGQRFSAADAAELDAAARSPVFAPAPLRSAPGDSPHPRLIVKTRSLAGARLPDLTYQPQGRLLPDAYRRKAISDGQWDYGILPALQANAQGHGFLAASDVGVGKTRMAAAVAGEWLETGQAEQVLYVTASEVNIQDVKREFDLYAGGKFPFEIVEVKGFKESKERPGKGEPEPLPAVPKAVYLVDRYNLSGFSKAILLRGFDAIIGDEAHLLKNIEEASVGKAWLAIQKQTLSRRGKFMYLTATPAVAFDDLEHFVGLREWAVDGFEDYKQAVTGAAEPRSLSEVKERQEDLLSRLSAVLADAEKFAAWKAENIKEPKPFSKAEERDQILKANIEALYAELGPLSRPREAMGGDAEAVGVRAQRRAFFKGSDIFRTAFITPAEQEQIMRELAMKGKYDSVDLWRSGVEFSIGTNVLTKQQVAEYEELADFFRDLQAAFSKFGRLNKRKRMFTIRHFLQAEAKRRMFDYRLGHAIREAKDALAKGEQPVISSISVSAGGETTGPIPAAINSINDREVEMDKVGNVISDQEIPEALIVRAELLERWQRIRTMPDPVEAVQAEFGEDKVAVVTGETPPRLREKVIREFQEGRRPVAFISGAGKIGISLHHILETPGKAKGRRHMIVADFEWSATTFKQEMGRVDRSGQLSSPKITVLSTGSAGERKFVATIANRMRNLGALSKGSAEAASNDKLAEFEIGGGLDTHAMRNAYREVPDEVKDRFLARTFRDPNDPTRNTRSYPQAASLKDFLLDLQFMPTKDADLAFEKFWEQRQKVMADQEAAQEELGVARTRINQGKVLRTTELRPDLSLHEVQDESGQRFGILQGIVTDYMHLVGQRLPKGPTGLPVRRYITFRAGDDQIAGLEIRPGAISLVARAFGKRTGGRVDTPERALEALQAGDRLPLQGEAGYLLRLRPSDQRIQIEKAKMADRDLLQRHGASYAPVGNVWFLTPETLPKFLERFPVRKEVEAPSAADDATKNNLRVEEPQQPLLPETPRPEMPKEKLRPEAEQKDIEETPLFGRERARREREAKEAQQELPGLKERAKAYGVDTAQSGWQDRLTEGQRALLAKEPYAVRPGEDPARAHQLAFEAIGDLDGARHAVSVTARAVARRGLRDRGTRGGAGVRTLGLAISPELIRTGRLDFRGRIVRFPSELAQLAQVYRDPRFETLRIFYLRGDQIVAHEGVTSRLPGTSQLFVTKGRRPPSEVRGFEAIRRRMKRLGADGYYLLHNHPSGRAKMSEADERVTAAFERQVPGFKGHVVIDSGLFSVLEPGKEEAETHRLPSEADPLHVPSISHDLLKGQLRNPDSAASVGLRLKSPEGFVTLLYRSGDGSLRAIQEMPETLFRKTEEASRYIKARMSDFGAAQVLSYSSSQDPRLVFAADKLREDRALLDHVAPFGSVFGDRPAELIREEEPRGFRVEEEIETVLSSDAAVERALTSTSAKGMPRLRDKVLEAYTAFRRTTTFEYDLRGLPVEQDEFRLFQATRRRAFAKAGEDIVGVVGRLKDAKDLAHFTRIVLLRDYRARAADPERFPGGVPEGLTQEQIDTELAKLEASSNENLQEATAAHRRLMDAERADLEARELMDPERAIPDYFPHFVLKHEEPRREFPVRGRIREPRRPFLKRARGSEADIETDYIRAMFRHRAQVRLANAIDDFALGILQRLDRRTALPKEVRRTLRPGQLVEIDGKPYRAFQYKPGRAIFPAQTATEKAIAEAIARGEPAMIPVEELRKLGALGRWNRMYVVPEAIADRFENFAPKEAGTMLRILNRVTSRWKGVTIGFWGSAGNVMNLMGDLANMVRQEPRALLALPKATAEVLRWRYGNGSDLTKLMEEYDVLSSGYVANEVYFRSRAPEIRQFLSKAQRTKAWAVDRVGGMLAGGILGAAAGGPGGAVVGGVAGAALGARGVLREVPEVREAIPRTAMAIAQLRRTARGAPLRGRGIAIEGLPAEQAAMKIAREFTVDYGKFTPDEDRLLRGLLLPFYAWAKTNTVNWLRYLVYAPFAFLGFLGVRFLLEAWNNQDDEFQKVEQSLPPYKRQQAHVVTGWKDQDGKMIVAYYAGDPMADAMGWVGLGGSLNRISDLMTERIEPGKFASDQMRAFVADPGQRMVNLLTPLAKVPIEMSTGKSALTGQEIVPRALEGTPEAFRRRLRHGAESAFRPLRETRKLQEAEEFDWMSNRWGLGLPIESVDPARAAENVAMQRWFEAKAEFVERRLYEFRQSEEFAKLSPRQQEAMLKEKAERAGNDFRRFTPFPVSRQRRLFRRMQ